MVHLYSYGVVDHPDELYQNDTMALLETKNNEIVLLNNEIVSLKKQMHMLKNNMLD